jgi:hypothetical protein
MTRFAWFLIVTSTITVLWQAAAILGGHTVELDRQIAVVLWICLGWYLRETGR